MLPRALRLLSLLPLLALLHAGAAAAATRQLPAPQHAGPAVTSLQALAPVHLAADSDGEILASPLPPAATPVRAGLHPGNLAPPPALGSVPLFRYEHGGRRISASGPSGHRSWLWSGDDVVEEEQAGTARVYERAGGLVLGFGAVDTSNYAVLGHESFVTDGLGSVVARVPDVPGAIAWHRYDAWGVFRLGAANDGTAPGAAGATLYGAEGRACLTCPQRFTAPGAGMSSPGFAGQYWDAEAGLSYAEQRWYAPELGSFLSVDPMLGTPSDPASMHVWGYANANPTRFVDPRGEQGLDTCSAKGPSCPGGMATPAPAPAPAAAPAPVAPTPAAVPVESTLGDLITGGLGLLAYDLFGPGPARTPEAERDVDRFTVECAKGSKAHCEHLAKWDPDTYAIASRPRSLPGDQSPPTPAALPGASEAPSPASLPGVDGKAPMVDPVDAPAVEAPGVSSPTPSGPIGDLPPESSAGVTVAGGDSDDARRGREEHERFKARVKAKGKGWQSEPNLIDPKTGKTVKPDALTPSGRPIELKPNTPSGRKKGKAQLPGYERATGKKGKVVYYKK